MGDSISETTKYNETSNLKIINQKVISYIQDIILFDRQYQDDNYIYIKEICNYLEKHPDELKLCLLKLEETLYNLDNNNIINEKIRVIWYFLKKYKWLNIYDKIEKDNYIALFEFFLCMIHNIPIIPPYCDNTVSGCYYFNKTLIQKYHENHEYIFYAYKCIGYFIELESNLKNNCLLEEILKHIKPTADYMRIQHWINKHE